MLRPSENEIWLALDGKDFKSADKVAAWLSTEEGRNWIVENTELIMKRYENSHEDQDIPSEEMLVNIHSRIGKLKRRRKIMRVTMYAASLLLPLVLITAVWLNINTRLGNALWSEPQTVCESAAMGERKVVIFQDGTKVYLNAGSKLSYPSFWSLDRRDVTLEGEGLFEVQKNSRRPLVIDMNGVWLKVYGTRFNVSAYLDDDFVDVTLLEGKVVFETENRKYEISPSEKLEYFRKDGKVKIVRMRSPEDEIMWTKNVIMFRNNSLREITEVLGRWYGVTFIVEDEELYQRTFTFKTGHQPLPVLLDEMEYVSDLCFKQEGDVVKVTRKL